MQDINISIVGLGACEAAQLSDSAMSVLLSAQLVLGSERQLKVVRHLLNDRQITPFLPKLDVLQKVLTQYYQQGVQAVVILASGDPLYYGIGTWFSRHYAPQQLSFYPAISSMQEVCHRLGLTLQDTQVLSLHGRAVAKLRSQLRENHTLLVLTDQQSTPQILANELVNAGYHEAQIIVCESIGYRYENIERFDVKNLVRNPKQFDALHISVIETGKSSKALPQFPGFANHHFLTDGDSSRAMITKVEVRLAVLSLLAPKAGDVIYDIGAGCGSVSVELGYWCERAKIIAIEKNAERFEYLQKNQQKFGLVSNLQLVHGQAPQALDGLAKANKIFIGGSDGNLIPLLEQQWDALEHEGKIVATAVLEETKQQLMVFLKQRNIKGDSQSSTQQIAVSHGEYLAGKLIYRPALPVSIFSFTKTNLNKAIAASAKDTK
jgi:precorrin-6Y C5,15-methyltransferase (decarboxylating)